MAELYKISRFTVILGVACLELLFFVIMPVKANAAASLYMSPPTGTFVSGNTFTVSLYVDTGGQAVNAVEANLSFPPDKLQVVSPTTGKSFVQIWVSQPSYSNEAGTMKFQGTVPTPGINTNAGLISTVTFRVKSIGTAAIKILDNSHVFLNDGRGTDVLGQKSDGIYYLTLPPPQGPTVTSRTNPDQEKWYNAKTVSLEWAAPPDVEGFSYMLDQDPAGGPDNVSEGAQTKVSYSNLADGIYYFHIKSLRQGSWGGVTDYVIRIDNTPPAAFNINISPSDTTSNHRPIFDFSTTDAMSGIDHYELKIISLDLPASQLAQNTTPFFIETQPPYSTDLNDGRYDVIARAYDATGNYYEATAKITIGPAVIEYIGLDGIRIGGVYTLGWPLVIPISIVLLIILLFVSRLLWRWHRQVEEALEHGIHEHPPVAKKLEELRKKQSEYGGDKIIKALFWIVASATVLWSFSHGIARADQTTLTVNVPIEPPLVTLFPKTISNDEILYVGGRVGAPSAWVLLHLQEVDTGAITEEAVQTDKTGAWFFSYPQFLESGHYILWTQLKVGQNVSAPSSQMDLIVAPTAVQIGDNRFSYQDLYMILFLLFAAAFVLLLVFSIYHGYHFKKKSRKFNKSLKEAEESIRRGFSILRRDIEEELVLIRKIKLSKELSSEEKVREEKLLKDLDFVGRYVGREIWEAEKDL